MGAAVGNFLWPLPAFCARDNQATFRVATWNILSPRQKNWPQRRIKILERLEALEADVVALQEALPRDPTDSLNRAMRDLGYEALHKPAADVSGGIEPPILYVRNAMFSIQWHDCHRRTVAALLQKRNFSGPPIYILNVHLMGAPREGRQRISQVRNALRTAKNQLDLDPKAPCLIVGDFNEAPREGPLQTLMTAPATLPPEVDVPGGLRDWLGWEFQDVYMARLGDKAPKTWPGPIPYRRLDYVLASPPLHCTQLCAPLAFDWDCPSDHLLLAADFRLLASDSAAQSDAEEENAD